MNTNTPFTLFESQFAAERAAIWRHIYERNQNVIGIKKIKFAVPNLELIINSTLRMSNQSSFASMSLRDLSRETGLSMGSLYSYIESKESLMRMILEHVHYLVDTVLGDMDGDDLEPQERLRWLLRRHVFLSEIMQPWFFFAYMEAKSFDESGKRMAIRSELRTQALIATCLSAGQAAGIFKPHDPVMTASLIKPLLQDWYLKRWKYRRNQVSPDEYATWVIRFVEAFIERPSEPLAYGSSVASGAGAGAEAAPARVSAAR